MQAVLTKGFDDMMLVGNFAGRPSMIHNYMNPAAYIHSHHTLQAWYCSSSSNNMQLCIHAYMHTCLHAYIHTCIHTCIHTYMQTAHAFMRPDTQTYMHAYIQYIHAARPPPRGCRWTWGPRRWWQTPAVLGSAPRVYALYVMCK